MAGGGGGATGPGGRKKARIEIIPLIDIMFFLLASFMLVSLSMLKIQGLKVTLPTAKSSAPENKPDFLTLSITKTGDLGIDKDPIRLEDIIPRLVIMRIVEQPLVDVQRRAELLQKAIKLTEQG